MYTLVHNGYKVSYHDSMEEVTAKIDETLENYKDLSPVLTTDETGTYTNHYGEKLNTSIKVYTYSTLYMEVFLIIEGSL